MKILLNILFDNNKSKANALKLNDNNHAYYKILVAP